MQNQDIWKQLKQKLPFGGTPEQTARRLKIWDGMDVNGNGYLSLAEIDKGMRDIAQIPILFNLKPVMMRAYQAAKNKLKANNQHGDDYVSKAEFKFLLKYLRQYYQYWVGFDRIDHNDDRRVSQDQFVQAVPIMKKWGINITNPKQSFKEADGDGKGMILFIQFCDWAIKKNMDLEDDDDLV